MKGNISAALPAMVSLILLLVLYNQAQGTGEPIS